MRADFPLFSKSHLIQEQKEEQLRDFKQEDGVWVVTTSSPRRTASVSASLAQHVPFSELLAAGHV